jgi:integrase
MNVIAIRPAGQTKPAPRRVHLDAGTIKRLPVPGPGVDSKGRNVGRNVIHWDDEVTGLGLRITSGGSRSFVFGYRVKGTGQQRRVTIGQFPNWTAGAARTRAKQLDQQVDVGQDPRGGFEALREAPTVAALCDRFEREHLPRKRPSTAESYTRALRLHVRPHFGKYAKVADVTFADVDKLHQKVTKAGSPYQANRVVAVLSKLFSLAIKWRMRTDNPAKGVERNYEAKLERYLTGDELARILEALASHSSDRQFADIIRMLILTGARKGEIFAMRWADIELARGIWTKLGSTTKQKTNHVVSLSEPVLLLLADIHTHNSGFVFPSDGKTGHVVEIKRAWAKLLKAAGITGRLRIHDLRHNFASHLASGGANLPLIGALLGHSNPATTARYAHLFQDPQRAAAEKVAAIVAAAELRGGQHE